MPQLAILFFLLTSSLFADLARDNASFVQEDGKRVTVSTEKVGSKLFFKVTRTRPSGSLDTSFMTTGVFTFQFGKNNSEGLAAIAYGDGDILVGGGASQGDKHSFALARLSSNGAFDTTFHTDGRVTSFMNGDIVKKLTISEDTTANEFEIVAWGCESEVNCESFAVFKSNGSLEN